jgi:putative ABC transport system permease protein
LYALGLIGAFLLLIACINFVNLATAQAIRRSKEVGVRKVLGSTRGQLVRQFLSETALITFAAVTLAVGITLLVLPYVPQLLDVTLPQSLLLEPDVLSFLAAVFVSVSIVSGIYPAWVLSGYKPVLALKNRLTGHPSGGVTLRRGMVTFQFAVAQLLIIGTAVVAGQMRFFGKADLGFDKEAILTVALPDNQPDKLRYLENQLKGRPEVKNISFSFNSASAESNAMGDLHYKAGNRDETIRTQFKFVDLHFMDTYGIRLLAGEPLGQMDLNRGDSAARILVNQVFLRRMGLRHPAEAVGKTIHNGDQLLTVIGVVADFHVNSLLQQIDPTLLMVSPREYQQAAIKLQPGHTSQQALGQVIARLGQVWAQLYPDHVFRYQFLDEALAQAYHKENKTLKLLNVFAAIAILISCLGIYGLVSFMAVQRTKEVGIRKILGASVAHIVYLFSKEFVVLILVAFLIAAPVGYYLMNSWLQAFQFRISLGAGLFLLTVGLAVLIALLTVSFQSVKAALANPVKSLRNE